MIVFDPNKTKTMSFDVEVKNISPELLEYNLRLFNEQIHYGFKGKVKHGSITFEIPPLGDVISPDLLENINGIKLEVNDRNNKYYLKPFEDSIKIEIDPSVTVSMHENIDETVKNDIKIDVVIKEETDIKPIKPKKKSAFSKFIEE